MFIEQSYYITEYTDLEGVFKKKYDVYYFGDSYCQLNLVKTLKKYKNIIAGLLREQKKVVILTSQLNDLYLEKVLSFLDNFLNYGKYELVVNDYGLLEAIKNYKINLPLIFGNFLVFQQKDPMLVNDSYRKERTYYIQVSNGYYNSFLKENNFKLVELYNTFQEIKVSNNINLSYYYPYVVYTITRYCPSKLIDLGTKKSFIIEECEGCEKIAKVFYREDKIGDYIVKNYYVGNKQFYENLDKSFINNLKVKRIVYNYDLLPPSYR